MAYRVGHYAVVELQFSTSFDFTNKMVGKYISCTVD